MFSFLAGAIRLDALMELPETFAATVKQYAGSSSQEMTTRVEGPPDPAETTTINTFQDFYTQIKKFKQENPSLYLLFLDDENITVLQHLATIYDTIDDYMSSDDKKIIREYTAIQRKHNLHRIFDKSSMSADTEPGEIKAVLRTVGKAYDIFDYKNLILNLNNTAARVTIFSRLCAGKNDEEKNAIAAVESEWQRRKHLAFLTSAALREAEVILDQFASYIRMIEDQFLQNAGYSQRVYEYWRGITEEKKAALSQLVKQAKSMLAREREKLAQAMIVRLELPEREHLIAAISGADESKSPIFDDVVLDTLLSLKKFGVNEQYIGRFRRIARHTLTYGLMKTFYQFIVAYGNEDHKYRLSALLNGAVYRAHAAVLELEKPAGRTPPEIQLVSKTKESADEKQFVISNDLLEKIFPQIKNAAAAYFSPARFREYEVLHAIFLEKTIKYIENNGLDIDIAKACDSVYAYMIRQYIKDISDLRFTREDDGAIKENFVKLAEFFFLGMQPSHQFDENVIERSCQYLAVMKQVTASVGEYARSKKLTAQKIAMSQKIFLQMATDVVLKNQTSLDDAMMEARREVYIFVTIETLRQAGIDEVQLSDFCENCRRNVKLRPDSSRSPSEQLCRQVELEKQLIIDRQQLIQLISIECKKLRMQMSDRSDSDANEKIRERIVALERAGEKLGKINSLAELKSAANELMLQKEVMQPYSFFGRKSMGISKLRSQVEKINKLSL